MSRKTVAGIGASMAKSGFDCKVDLKAIKVSRRARSGGSAFTFMLRNF
jgi:hypothetical protein